MHLRQYFEPEGQVRALEAFSSFATSAGSAGWPIHERLEMYKAFALITDPSNADYPRFKRDVYGILKSYWQVFRPHDVAECWPPDKIFHVTVQVVAII